LGITGILPLNQAGWLIVSLGPTVVFLILLTWILWDTRGMIQPRAQRAINAVFSAAGATNLVMLIIIGTYAVRSGRGEVWELYACVVFALQGAGWLVAYTLRRRLWLLGVA